MTSASLVQTLQAQSLMREIERQVADETRAIGTAAEREAQDLITRAHAGARRRMHDAIEELRAEQARQIARAHARLETDFRTREQRQTAAALEAALPLLRAALVMRWCDGRCRARWTQETAAAGRERLRGRVWRVAHPADWTSGEQQDFAAALAPRDVSFASDDAIAAGLRITADEATLDATPDGLLADTRSIGALLLAAIERGGEDDVTGERRAE